eukprot:11930215-Prorocentrum_lima.AAC.1
MGDGLGGDHAFKGVRTRNSFRGVLIAHRGFWCSHGGGGEDLRCTRRGERSRLTGSQHSRDITQSS